MLKKAKKSKNVQNLKIFGKRAGDKLLETARKGPGIYNKQSVVELGLSLTLLLTHPRRTQLSLDTMIHRKICFFSPCLHILHFVIEGGCSKKSVSTDKDLVSAKMYTKEERLLLLMEEIVFYRIQQLYEMQLQQVPGILKVTDTVKSALMLSLEVRVSPQKELIFFKESNDLLDMILL